LLHSWVFLELEALPLERDRVVELELRGTFENFWDCVLAEVPRKRADNICEYEGNIVGHCFGDDGGQSGERVVQTASTTRDGTIDQNKNGSDVIQVLLNLCRNILPVELGLLRTASVKQSRRVEDANLENRLFTLITSINAAAYHYAVLARKFVEARRVGLTLVTRTILFVGMVEDLEVVVVNVVTCEDIGDEFHE